MTSSVTRMKYGKYSKINLHDVDSVVLRAT